MVEARDYSPNPTPAEIIDAYFKAKELPDPITYEKAEAIRESWLEATLGDPEQHAGYLAIRDERLQYVRNFAREQLIAHGILTEDGAKPQDKELFPGIAYPYRIWDEVFFVGSMEYAKPREEEV